MSWQPRVRPPLRLTHRRSTPCTPPSSVRGHLCSQILFRYLGHYDHHSARQDVPVHRIHSAWTVNERFYTGYYWYLHTFPERCILQQRSHVHEMQSPDISAKYMPLKAYKFMSGYDLMMHCMKHWPVARTLQLLLNQTFISCTRRGSQETV